MGCPTTPTSCLDPSVIFAGVYNATCNPGFGDPSYLRAERLIYSTSYEFLINSYGVEIDYYVNGFDITKANLIYGEHPLQEYSQPFVIKAYLENVNESFQLGRFGYESDDTVVLYISINTFQEKFIEILHDEYDIPITDNLGNPLAVDTIISNFLQERNLRIEPKSDDLISLTSFGCDRPGGRGNKIFRISEVKDQSIQDGINPLGGHYVWKITATRYETSHETNSPQEVGNDQVYDNLFSGKETSTDFPSLTTQPKAYDYDVDTDSKENVYDMSRNDNSLYGEYY